MIHLSKSKYCSLWQCPKMAWLNKYKPEVKTEDPSLETRFSAGNEVGDLAMGLFGDYVEVTAYDDEKLDLERMIENTVIEMDKGTPIICEASFSYNGLYCAVDILRKESDGWAIYEVKSSTNNEEKEKTSFAFKLARAINHDIPKYRTLMDFQIQVGAAYGDFYDFEFNLSDEESEITTIGYPANYAAKLQGLSGPSSIAISSDIYNSLPLESKKTFERVDNKAIEKYGQKCFFRVPLILLKSAKAIESSDLDYAKEYANSFNLSDISLSEAHVPINFRDVSKTQCKKTYGIPVFADVRGFTKQFAPDGSNLEQMAIKTQSILSTMYEVTTNHGGIHIQFQGDRELSLYHDLPSRTDNSGILQPESKCYKQAVLASMRMIDRVKPLNVHIGVGEDYGRLFATRIGARGEKDNILLGETVIQADIMEDQNAKEDQLAITREVYTGLQKEDPFLASQFKSMGEYYIATIGYQEYVRNRTDRQQRNNTASHNYNPAWRN